MQLRRVLSLFCAAASTCVSAVVVDKAFIIELADRKSLHSFHENAKGLDYSVRQTFDTPGVYVGLSIDLPTENDAAESRSLLEALPGVKAVHDVIQYDIPKGAQDSSHSADQPATRALRKRQDTPGDLSFTLAMAGVDKLHAAGIKGKGIKVGIVDTGVDYKHPALGGGFGPGKKIVGGYSFITDNGTTTEIPDPYAACESADHGTHVAGIVGMDPLQQPDGFPITGVAPEASLYMYRVFSCQKVNQPGRGGTNDLIMKAMIKALEDKVDVLSMSLSLSEGQVAPIPKVDAVQSIAERLHDAGIAVTVAMGNTGAKGEAARLLYSQTLPSELKTVISVASVADSNFPLVYKTEDSSGATFHYSAVHPIDAPDGLDVYLLEEDSCFASSWATAIETIQAQGNLNKTIIAYRTGDNCRPEEAACCGNNAPPPYILAVADNAQNVFNQDYETPHIHRFNDGATRPFTMIKPDSSTLIANYQAAGGYKSYKLTFADKAYTSPKQRVGGEPDWFTSYGPLWHTYELKPQLAAPGGHILSTYPLSLGGYGMISGTSMATPFAAGCYALVKSQFPDLSVGEILELLQATARPTPWPHNEAILAATVEQGAGLVNAYDAVASRSRVSPGQLRVWDNDRTTFGVVNFTVENRGGEARSYRLGHRGAGFLSETMEYLDKTQMPRYGSVEFPTPTFDLAAGAATQIFATVVPPPGVDASRRSVFGGYIDIYPSSGTNLSIPYAGPAYSLFQTDYIFSNEGNGQGITQPSVQYVLDPATGTRTEDRGFLEVSRGAKYSSFLNRRQWTELWKVDIVPANTTLTAYRYASNSTVPEDYVYQPSADKLTSRLFGKRSYGTLYSQKGLANPGTTVFPSGTGLEVVNCAGRKVSLGPGDYRWYFSVLRWGGDVKVQGDYDTWLGPIIRLK